MNNHMTGNAISPILRKIMEMRLNKEIADKSAKILIKEILRLYTLQMAMYVRQPRKQTECSAGIVASAFQFQNRFMMQKRFFPVSGTLLILNISVIMPVTVTFSMKTVSEGSFPPIWKKLMLITRQHEEKCINFSEDMDS